MTHIPLGLFVLTLGQTKYVCLMGLSASAEGPRAMPARDAVITPATRIPHNERVRMAASSWKPERSAPGRERQAGRAASSTADRSAHLPRRPDNPRLDNDHMARRRGLPVPKDPSRPGPRDLLPLRRRCATGPRGL